MSSISQELQSLLEVVGKVAAAAGETSAPLNEARGSIESAGLLDLGRDTLDEPDARYWVTHVVRVAAEWSPSLGYVLAARYAADRAFGADADAPEPTFGLRSKGSPVVIATALEPTTLAIFDTDSSQLRSFRWAGLADSSEPQARTGLRGARLLTAVGCDDASEALPVKTEVMSDWDLLSSAILLGISNRAIRTTQTYVMERHQFGAPIGSFSGLRALIAEMDVKAAAVQAMLDVALEHDAPTEPISAAAGRAAVDICLTAVQAHGGYGYIDEYPVADLVRDAISAQARAGGYRLHLARVAERGLGPRLDSRRP